MANIREQLLDILEELVTEDVKKFQWHLTSSMEGFKHIPRAQLEKADRHDTVDKMVQSYGPDTAVEITQTILKKINHNQLAGELRAKQRKRVEKEVSFISNQTEELGRPCMGSSDKQRIQLMSTLTHTYERVLIGNSLRGHKKFLDDIYTNLIIVENETGGLIREHEVMQIEMLHNSPGGERTYIKCSDIFKVQCDRTRRNRKVLTMGIAGVGKTVSVNKFILDWAKQRENQDIHFVFSLPFRELNLKKTQKFSLMELLNQLFFSSRTSLKTLPKDDGKVLFIFDGLDECCFPLSFKNVEELKDVNKKASMSTLIINLVNGNLLPFALIWITCRPAAAHLIPRDYIDLVTEVRGFSDEQKDTYFSKFCNHNLEIQMKIISHIKKSRTLNIMCQIPIFCWISAMVLKPLLEQESNKEIPTTLTGMYINFLLQQKKLMEKKYHEAITRDDSEHINLKLGKLAFRNLQHGTLIFYEENLRKCGIEVSDGAVFSGVCTQIFSQQEGISERNIFSFVHLSVQESLAALYVHYKLCNNNVNAFKQTSVWNKLKWKNKTITDLHKYTVEKTLKSENGHFDLFLRFLIGFSLDSNQSDLKELLPSLKTKAQQMSDLTDYIKEKLNEEISYDRSLNLFHCLSELKDSSLTSEIQNYLNSGLSRQALSCAQWAALVFVLLMSEKTQDKFELKKYLPSDEGLKRLLPVLKNTRQARLDHCKLSKSSCEALVSVFSSDLPLRELDLSNNNLQDSGVDMLFSGLKSSHCKLQVLRLDHCQLSMSSCEAIASVFNSDFPLKELDLSNNDLQDSGVILISDVLKSPHCKLQVLRLSGCLVKVEGCCALANALNSSSSHLKELDLTYNHPTELGLKLLYARVEDVHCKLVTLMVENAGKSKLKPGLRKYSCGLTLDPNTAHSHLSLIPRNTNTNVKHLRKQYAYTNHPERFDDCEQVLCRESLSGRCYWEAEWSGREAVIAVTYKAISRKGVGDHCRFGYNEHSWSLFCSNYIYSAWHNKKCVSMPAHSSHSRRVGVYLDWPAGTLSFYGVSTKTNALSHIHTFHSTFTEPVYAGFWIHSRSEVCLFQAE